MAKHGKLLMASTLVKDIPTLLKLRIGNDTTTLCILSESYDRSIYVIRRRRAYCPERAP